VGVRHASAYRRPRIGTGAPNGDAVVQSWARALLPSLDTLLELSKCGAHLSVYVWDGHLEAVGV